MTASRAYFNTYLVLRLLKLDDVNGTPARRITWQKNRLYKPSGFLGPSGATLIVARSKPPINAG